MGLSLVSQARSTDEEIPVLNKWTIEKIEGNKRLWWGDGEGNRGDPRSQTEDLSDNAMKASSYGIKNLQRIIIKLPEWTRQENKDFTGLGEMYGQVTTQFGRYIGHVSNNVGGIQRTPKGWNKTGPFLNSPLKNTEGGSSLDTSQCFYYTTLGYSEEYYRAYKPDSPFCYRRFTGQSLRCFDQCNHHF